MSKLNQWMNRRQFMRAAAFTSLLSHYAKVSGQTSLPQAAPLPSPTLLQNPFTLGVASGSPEPDGMVLWTRLAPEPLQSDGQGGMPAVPFEVHWEVAADEAFRQILQRGVALAEPALAHSVHVEVQGLKADSWYFYRFRVQAMVSPVGRTRTTPALGQAVSRVRFAYASCQHYEHGFFGAYRQMAQENVDFVAFLGDYIYEYRSSRDATRVRHHQTPELFTLADYRNRYALYKQDADLQRMHAQVPWLLVWDDHEVSNDYAKDQSQELMANFLARRAAAYQAYYEHQPLRRSTWLKDFQQTRIYGQVAWGNLANFYLLDDRQYRDYQVCPKPDMGGSNTVNLKDCPNLLEPQRSLLGAAQENWLNQTLAASHSQWNVLLQQTLFASVNQQRAVHSARGPRYWTDGWDGYPAARNRLLHVLQDKKVSNPVVVGGDVHANWVSEVHYQNQPLATEFCGTSITSPSWPQEKTDEIAQLNPHVKLANSEKRGYGVIELTAQSLTAHLRVVDDVKLRQPQVSTLASFTVPSGTARIKPIP